MQPSFLALSVPRMCYLHHIICQFELNEMLE